MAHLYKRGQQYWISFYLDGKLKQKSLKTKNERVALSKRKQIEYELSIGDLHIASRLPLSVLLEAFCKYLRNIRTRKSYKNDISRLRTFFGPICESLIPYSSNPERRRKAKDKFEKVHLKAELLEDITAEMVNRFIGNRVAENNWSPKTVNLHRQTLHKLFAYAIKYQGFRSRDRRYPNPAAAVERMREKAPQIRYLELEDIPVQLEAVESSSSVHALVATYIYAGLRREEALWLTLSDVDLELRLIRIRAKTVNNEYWQPKTKRNRVVPISSQLYAILKNYRCPNEGHLFFPSPNGKRWDPDNFSQDLRKLNNQAGLVWSCLDFRHTFGSQLAQKGESLYKISELMGNSPEICRKHYAALIPERMKDTVEFDVRATLPSNEKDPEIHGMLKEILGKLGGDEDDKPRIRLVR